MRDRKELLRTLLDEVVLTAPRDSGEARIRMVWRSGQFTDLVVPRPPRKPRAAMRTSEETVALLRRLAAPVSRRSDRRGPQPPRPPHGTGTALHPGTRRQSAQPLEDRVLPAA